MENQVAATVFAVAGAVRSLPRNVDQLMRGVLERTAHSADYRKLPPASCPRYLPFSQNRRDSTDGQDCRVR
jgi:hypothetical protein